jgi:hypothetical protein
VGREIQIESGGIKAEGRKIQRLYFQRLRPFKDLSLESKERRSAWSPSGHSATVSLVKQRAGTSPLVRPDGNADSDDSRDDSTIFRISQIKRGNYGGAPTRRRTRSCGGDKTVHDQFSASLVEIDGQLGAVDGDNFARAKFAVHHPRSGSEDGRGRTVPVDCAFNGRA